MTRRKRIRRWIRVWRRLIAFGKMLQVLHDEGFTLITWCAPGAQVRVVMIDRDAPPPAEAVLSLNGREIARAVEETSNVRALFAQEPPPPPPPGPADPPKPPDHRPVA